MSRSGSFLLSKFFHPFCAAFTKRDSMPRNFARTADFKRSGKWLNHVQWMSLLGIHQVRARAVYYHLGSRAIPTTHNAANCNRAPPGLQVLPLLKESSPTSKIKAPFRMQCVFVVKAIKIILEWKSTLFWGSWSCKVTGFPRRATLTHWRCCHC